MAVRKDAPVFRASELRELPADVAAPLAAAYLVLRSGFTVAPIVMGADKFLGILEPNAWTGYLWSAIPQTLGISPPLLMYGVGVIEMVAGVLVFLSARHFAWLVAAWLGLIIVNLLPQPEHWDIAMRDFGLMLGAIALGLIAKAVHEAKATR